MMQCERIEELLPSFAGNDLPDAEMRIVRGHLTTCASCQERANVLRETLDFVRAGSEPDFGDEFYSSIRAGVFAELGKASNVVPMRARPTPWVSYGLAASVAALAMMTVVWLTGERPESNLTTRSASMTVGRGIAEAPEAGARVEAGAGRITSAAIAEAEPGRNRFRTEPARRVRARKEGRPVRVTPRFAVSTDDMMRIEYQTADPDIRIIWFVPKPEPDTGSATTGA